MRKYKKCIQCKNIFYKLSKSSIRQWSMRKFCSLKCAGAKWATDGKGKRGGWKLSNETKEKIKNGNIKSGVLFKEGHIPWNKGLKGFLSGEKHYRFGKHLSQEVKDKISNSRKGKCVGSSNKKAMLGKHHTLKAKNSISKKNSGEKSGMWKGDRVGYTGLHYWVRKVLGHPKLCSHCGLIGERNNKRWNIHWANKSSKYKRDISDWISLCPKCHKKFDKK